MTLSRRKLLKLLMRTYLADTAEKHLFELLDFWKFS